MDSQDRQRQILRLMAWQRAKGELNSMLMTHVREQEQYDRLKKVIMEFIVDVEDNGKHE